MRRLKILIADDHRLMLDALRASLENDENIEIVGEADAGTKVLPLVGQTGPDIVLLDVRMPGMDGFAVLERIRERYPQVKVVMLSAVDEPAVIGDALNRGATAYLLKQVEPDDLAGALRGAAAGTVYTSVADSAGEREQCIAELRLSKRELMVLEALESGRSNRQVASDLFLAEQTVKFHLTNIYKKLGVSSRTEALHFAYEHGLVKRPLTCVA